MINAVIASLGISLLSLIGIFTLSMNESLLQKILNMLVSFSAGTILGASLFDLLPEAVESVPGKSVYIYISMGFVAFLFLERLIYWYHGSGHIDSLDSMGDGKPVKEFAYLNLMGDFIHNFIDGMIIAAGFTVNLEVGIVTSIAVAFHELPQEMGDYGILVYAGISKRLSLIYNFLAASSVIWGSIIGSFFLGSIEAFSGLLIAFSTGAFLFLSASELVPEMSKERDTIKALIQMGFFILGLLTILGLGFLFDHG
ncbi:MAG: ZIP family metal transporter [Candidatus Bathyarchaeia archaeon]